MTFTKASKYHLKSDCGKYTVSKAASGHGFIYTAWRGKEMLGHEERVEDAKALCLKHGGVV